MLLENIKPDKLGMPDVTDKIRLALHKKYAKAYIIYKKHKTYVDCYCTHCMTRYRLYFNRELITPDDVLEYETARTIAHDVKITCHNCGCEAVARAERISRNVLEKQYQLCYFFVRKKAVYAVCGVLTCGYGYNQSVDEMEKHYGGSRWDKFYVMEYKPNNARLIARTWYGEFSESKRMYEPYLINGGIYGGYSFFKAENPEVLKNSFLKYIIPREYKSPDDVTKSAGTDYNGYQPLKFMTYAVKYPAVEMLLKSGGEKIVEEIVDQKVPHKKVIDLDGKTAAEVFRTDGNDAAIIRKAMKEQEITISVLQCWNRLKSIARREKRKYKFEDAIRICRLFGSYNNTLSLILKTGLTPEKYINYIERQAKHYKESPCVIEYAYKDYINECEALHYDLHDTQICKPAKLYEAHERTSAALNAIRAELALKAEIEKEKEYREYYKKLCEKYGYTSGRYVIIVPKGAGDIVNEGKQLSHCVGGYAERHMAGKLAILFMRNTSDPDTPLYTIEMHGNELIQIRGKHNCAPSKEAREFVAKWLEWVKLPKSKKYPKSTNDKTSAA